MTDRIVRKTIGSAENERMRLFDAFADDLERGMADETERDLTLLAFVEAVNNAAEHGNENRPEQEIQVQYFMKDGFLVVAVNDQGPGHSSGFRDISKVHGRRGRGLGLIKANADMVFFNAAGNRIVFIKGVKTMLKKTDNTSAEVGLLPGGVVLLTDIRFEEPKTAVAHGITELFEGVQNIEDRTILLDLKNVRIITSMGWGSIFAQSENSDVKNIILFNSSEAILRTAKQMGLEERGGDYEKIQVHQDGDVALKIIAARAGAA